MSSVLNQHALIHINLLLEQLGISATIHLVVTLNGFRTRRSGQLFWGLMSTESQLVFANLIEILFGNMPS